MVERNGGVAAEGAGGVGNVSESEEVDVGMPIDEGRKQNLEEGKDPEGELASPAKKKKLTGVVEKKKDEGEVVGQSKEMRDGGGRKRELETAEGEDASGSAKRKRVGGDEGVVEGEESRMPEGEFGAKESKELSNWLWQQKDIGKEGEKVCIELEWKSGDQGNLLHQLLQYLQNRMTSIDFQH